MATAFSSGSKPRSVLSASGVAGVEVVGPDVVAADRILTPDALAFLAGLVRAVAPEREALLERRRERQLRLDAGELPDFLPETAALRTSAAGTASWIDARMSERFCAPTRMRS